MECRRVLLRSAGDAELIDDFVGRLGVQRFVEIVGLELVDEHAAEQASGDIEAIELRGILFETCQIAGNQARGIVAGKSVRQRSEEHTSELQSLIRNSYDVFCLNKKKTT